MRRILSFIVACGVAGSAWAAPLRVAAFNVKDGLEGTQTPSFQDVGRNLERIGADVVGLQEVRTFDATNFEALRQRLGYPYSLDFISSGFYHSQALLSRYPIVFKQWVWGYGMVRPIFLVQIDVPNLNNDPFLAVVHLKASSGSSNQFQRAVEMARLKKALQDQGVGTNTPVILMGDFNHVSSSDAVFGSDPDGSAGNGLVSDLPFPIYAYASTDGYFPDLRIFKLDLRHAGIGGETNTFVTGGALDHIMVSAPVRNRSPQSEIYDLAKDMAGIVGRPKFGDFPPSGSGYGSDHLPIFSDLVLRDEGDGFSEETNPPMITWNLGSNSLTFVNRAVASAAADVTATDDQDPAPGVSCYPLNPTYNSAGTKKITYIARDRMGNIQTVDRTVTVAAWGQGGLTHNLQWPPAMQIPINGQGTVYAQIYIPGWTETLAKVAPNVRCWIGVNVQNTDPSTWPDSSWKEAILNSSQGVGANADEYMLPLRAIDTGPGTFYYAVRWQIDGGSYGYGGIGSGGGGAWDGTTYAAGVLTVGSTIGSWSSNAPVTRELVGKYAIGGATGPAGVSEAPVMESAASTLSLTALVRKDDAKLTVEAEWVNDLAAGWSIGGVSSSTNGLSQPGDSGLERRRFTVPYDPATEPRKFLRLKATLQP